MMSLLGDLTRERRQRLQHLQEHHDINNTNNHTGMIPSQSTEKLLNIANVGLESNEEVNESQLNSHVDVVSNDSENDADADADADMDIDAHTDTVKSFQNNYFSDFEKQLRPQLDELNNRTNESLKKILRRRIVKDSARGVLLPQEQEKKEDGEISA